MLEWINTAISGVSELREITTGLSRSARGKVAHKKLIIRELRDNINVFDLAYRNVIDAEALIDRISNQRIVSALEDGNTLKLRRGRIREEHIEDKRNNRYLDWTSAQLVDKIDEKIQLIKNIKEGSGAVTIAEVENTNIGLILSNIYYRMKLLAKFLND